MTIELWGDKNAYVTDEVSTINIRESNSSDENRAKFVTDLASISRGNYESNNPTARFKHLMKEAANNPFTVSESEVKEASSRPLEFLGCFIKTKLTMNGVMVQTRQGEKLIDHIGFMNRIFRHGGYMVKEGNGIYTNVRALLNSGYYTYDEIPYNTPEEMEGFRAIRVSVPMFIWAQLMTHTKISKESQSDRVSKNNNYWLPADLYSKLLNASDSVCENLHIAELQDYIHGHNMQNDQEFRNMVIHYFLNNVTQNQCQTLLKDLGYKREIYSRAPYYFKYKEVVMTGWLSDPAVWNHFLVEREAYPDLHSSWTQSETREVANAIRVVIMGR